MAAFQAVEREPAEVLMGKRLRRMLGGLSVAAILLVPAVAAPSASAWTQQVDGVAPGSPRAAGSRVWWVTASSSDRQAGVVWLRSRAVGGGDVRAVRIVLPGPAAAPPDPGGARPINPGPARVSLEGVSGARAELSMSWCDDGPTPVCTGRLTMTVDSGTGVAIASAPLSVAERVLNGELVRRGPGVNVTPNVAREVLVDPSTGRRFGVIPAGATQVRGRFALRVTGQDRWLTGGLGGKPAGRARIRIYDLPTGKQRYSVPVRRIAEASASGRWVQVGRFQLQDDGSVAIGTAQWRRERGLRPVWVDRHGRVRRLGPHVAGAAAVQALYARGRGYVRVQEPRSGRLRCEATWIIGGRGATSARLRDRLTHEAWPLRWTGRYVAWSVESRVRLLPSPSFVSVTTGLDRMRLSRTDRPRC